MTLTEEQIAEIRARVEAATPGPWKWWTSNSWNRLKSDDQVVTRSVAEPFVNQYDRHPDLSINEADMDFIAHARDDIPALLSALEAANKRADEAEARRKCYECGSEMTACARCNPELPTAELTALRARVAELEAALRRHTVRILTMPGETGDAIRGWSCSECNPGWFDSEGTIVHRDNCIFAALTGGR